MAGVNPYIQRLPMNRPTRPYTVTFVDEATGERKSFRMDPATFPFGEIGLDGSLLAIAQEAGIEINHSCGGVCACSTCHVYVTEGQKSCSRSSEDEEDMLDEAPAVTPDSRLSCQCVPDGSADVVVVIPRWNRNQVKEAEH